MLRAEILVYCMIGLTMQSTATEAGGNLVEGEKVFQRCFSCHSIAEADPNKKGPPLRGIMGRPVASVAGYSYSAPMVTLGSTGAVWNEVTLDQFLKYPSEFVKGTSMTAPPVRRESERVDLIAFLSTLH
jgi:cytochrome c